MLIEYTLEKIIDKVQIAIERLQQFEPPEGYYLAFSGGKDSQCIYELAKMANIKFDAYFHFTTVDPPELLRFIKENYPDVIWTRPEKTMWQLIENKCMPPTRIVRYCCDYLKEQGGKDRVVITGVRNSESAKRKNRKMAETCYKSKTKFFLNPIIDWTEKDVWQFIKERNLPYCRLYDEGQKRIGCIMCPMQTQKGRLKDIERYPNFYKAYLKAFRKMIAKNKEKGLAHIQWNSPEEVMNWWIYQKPKGQEDKLFD